MDNTFAEELDLYLEDGTIDEVLGSINEGKEAKVFLARTTSRLVAIKIFKDRLNRSFKNKSDYFQHKIPSHRREARAIKNRTSFGLKLEESMWHSREVYTLQLLHEAGASVPEVFHVKNCSFMMAYFGNEETPAPRLSDMKRAINNPICIYNQIINNIKIFLDNNIVHGDLSPYNILYCKNDKIAIIDFPQAVRLDANNNSITFLRRDLENINIFFSKLGIENEFMLDDFI